MILLNVNQLCTLLLFLILLLGEVLCKVIQDPYIKCIEDEFIVSPVYCLPKSYKKEVPPLSQNPLEISLTFPITEISKIDTRNSILSIRLAYQIRWPELRLLLNQSTDWSEGNYHLSTESIKQFWYPDVIIHDMVRFYKPVMVKEVGSLEISPDKHLRYKVRADISIICSGMQYADYPMDEHKCEFRLTSFGYDDSRIKLFGNFKYNQKNQRTLPFVVRINPLPPHRTTYVGSSKNYSVYGFEISYRRSLSPFLLSIYLPSAMFVIMSWVSFIIPPDAYPARVGLLLTLCLMLINMFNSSVDAIPSRQSVTALEIWLLSCMCFVILAKLEYAVIIRMIIVYKRKDELPFKRVITEGTINLAKAFVPELKMCKDGENQSKEELMEREKNKLLQKKNILDSIAFFVFPFAYFLFNLIYWSIYLFNVI